VAAAGAADGGVAAAGAGVAAAGGVDGGGVVRGGAVPGGAAGVVCASATPETTIANRLVIVRDAIFIWVPYMSS